MNIYLPSCDDYNNSQELIKFVSKQDQAVARRIDRHGCRIYLPLIQHETFTPVSP